MNSRNKETADSLAGVSRLCLLLLSRRCCLWRSLLFLERILLLYVHAGGLLLYVLLL